MKSAQDLIPWKVTDISIRPFEGFWSFNASLNFDGTLWRCVLRNADYCMPSGKTVRSKNAGPGHRTKNAMVILDPVTWKPIKVFSMHELDGYPRTASANVGFEDMRIFRTDSGGLQGIAASLHLKRDTRPAAGGTQHQPPEQVLLSFDDEYNIVKAQPIRGDSWNSSPQKNWVPFDGAAAPRFLYSIGKGSLFDANGRISGDAAIVKPSIHARPVRGDAEAARRREEQEKQEQQEKLEDSLREQREAQAQQAQADEEMKARDRRARKPDNRTQLRGGSVAMVRGRRMVHDTVTSRPSAVASAVAPVRIGGSRVNTETARTLGSGRMMLPRYEGLRGGTQLIRVGEDAWLGIGHEMRFERSLKMYWHTWYVVNAHGKLTAASPPMKFVPNGIEFAAGLAVDGDRLVVSFGVDDMESKIAETKLSAVMNLMSHE